MGDGGPQRKGFVSVTDDADERFCSKDSPRPQLLEWTGERGRRRTGLDWAGLDS